MIKKLIYTFLILVALVISGLAILLILMETQTGERAAFTNNPQLETIKPDWPGTPIDDKGRYVNHEFPFSSKLSDLLRWTLNGNPQKAEKAADKDRIKILEFSDFYDSGRDGIQWLGHAGFFIRTGGKNILIDPVLVTPTLVNEYIAIPDPLDKIDKLDLLLISHDHRDHMDEASIQRITAKFPDAQILAGLGMDDLLKPWSGGKNPLQTASWYQRFQLSPDHPKITFVPTRHWSRRGLFDMNKRLWGAFLIETNGKTIYFGGDSGYGGHYREIGEMFPEIDYFIVGIGAYKPVWFMESNHNSPQDAYKGFVDAKAKLLIPMHYGRFDLSDEPPSEPLRELRSMAESEGKAESIIVPEINEAVFLD